MTRLEPNIITCIWEVTFEWDDGEGNPFKYKCFFSSLKEAKEFFDIATKRLADKTYSNDCFIYGPARRTLYGAEEAAKTILDKAIRDIERLTGDGHN